MIIGVMTLVSNCHALPLYNIQDTQPFHTVKGSDKYYSTLDSSHIQFHLSPYHQHAKSGRNFCGQKVSIGDIYGKWNMLGVFFGPGGNPNGALVTNFPANLLASKNAINILSLPDATVPTPPGLANVTGIYRMVGTDYTVEDQFNADRDTFAYYDSVHVRYERIGVRGQMSFDFKFGLGLGMRTGVADYKQKAEFNLANDFRKLAGLSFTETVDGKVTQKEPLPAAKSDGSVGTPGVDVLDKSAQYILRNLMDEKSRNLITKDLGLDLGEVRESKWEDTHLYMYWQHPFELGDKEGDFSCSIIPYISAGIWLPTGEERNPDKQFSIATGNDGFTMVTLDGSLSFDFPKMLQTSFGGGVMFANKRELSNQRVPTSIYQTGIIPWKTNIHKHPGLTWYLNASMKAEDIISTLSVYVDWLYTRHLKDSITLRETNENRRKAFSIGIPILERDSEWKNQQASVGFNYRVTPLLSFGFGLQAYISGVRVYRTTTTMGSVTLTF